MLWPARSPDLNPIEQLWDQLGRAVGTNATMQDLRQIVVDEWHFSVMTPHPIPNPIIQCTKIPQSLC